MLQLMGTDSAVLGPSGLECCTLSSPGMLEVMGADSGVLGPSKIRSEATPSIVLCPLFGFPLKLTTL